MAFGINNLSVSPSAASSSENNGDNFSNQVLFELSDDEQWVLVSHKNENVAEAPEQILRYEFRNQALLDKALTHPSFNAGKRSSNYRRQEFLGESILRLLITSELYKSYPQLSPGSLTKLRAANMDTEKLGRAAIRNNLHKYLRHRMPNLKEGIEDFIKETIQYPVHSYGLILAPKALADVVQALIGAVYEDSGFCSDTARKVCGRLLKPLITPETLEMNPTSQLKELCQRTKIKYMLDDTWEDNMTVKILVNNVLRGTATYSKSKKVAKNRAIKAALENLASESFR